MAKKTTTTGTALVNYEEELARQSQLAAGTVDAIATGRFFAIRGATLSFNDAPVAHNRMAVIIADFVLENNFYETAYDPDDPTPPTCYAFGRTEAEMKPHDEVFAAKNQQHDTCRGCEHNEFGSAEKGRGKACTNRVRLSLLPAAHLTEAGKVDKLYSEEDLADEAFAFLRLPPTSLKSFAAYVKSVSGALKRPPHGVLTLIEVVPDAKSQFKVVFKPLDEVPKGLLPFVMKKHEEARASIVTPYGVPEAGDAKTKARGNVKGRGNTRAR